jgi:hypothetical protein
MCGCLLLVTGAAAGAEQFDAASIAVETLQSRDFDRISDMRLLRASLAVIQDIGFQVTEAETEPGLIVAQSPGSVGGYSGHVLTVSLSPVTGEDSQYRLRLSATPNYPPARGNPAQGDYTDFYQAFFTHLDRELFRQRSSP